MAPRLRFALLVLAGGWLVLALAGLFVIGRADATPGGESHVARWPRRRRSSKQPRGTSKPRRTASMPTLQRATS